MMSLTEATPLDRVDFDAWRDSTDAAGQINLPAFKREIITFAPDVSAWRYMACIAWQAQFMRGEHATTARLGADLRAGDKIVQSMTGILFRLLEVVVTGVKWNGREYSVWRVVSVNTVGRAVRQETIYDCAEYGVWGK